MIEPTQKMKRRRRGAARVLIVSEEKALRTLVRSTLTFAGCQCVEAATIDAARTVQRSKAFDIAVVDLAAFRADEPTDKPRRDTTQRRAALSERWTILRRLPAVVLCDELTACEQLALREAGAEEFLAKPFGRDELTTRLHAVLLRRDSARFGASPDFGNELICGALKMEIAERRVTHGDRVVRLTPLEFNLLRVLMLNVGKVLSRRYLLKTVWGPHAGDNAPYLRVFVAALRAKIEASPAAPQYLRTERKVGYMLVAPAVA